jgi:hypothetical protein
VYPGQRDIQSGGYGRLNLFAGHLGYQFMTDVHTAAYRIFNLPTNQSEASNFLFLSPFLLIPSIYLLYRERRLKKTIDWPLAISYILFIIFLLQLYVPLFTPFSKLLGFQKVESPRILIGLGILNIVQLILFIRSSRKSHFSWPSLFIAGYVILVFAFELLIALVAKHDFPGFLETNRALLFSIPLPLVVFFLFYKKFAPALTIYLLFSILISVQVNPMYKGLAILTQNPVSRIIRNLSASSPSAVWVTEGLLQENLPVMNGAKSLSGVYYYPQPALWNDIQSPGANFVYNRYAHVNFDLTDGSTGPTSLALLGGDHFSVTTPVCGSYLKEHNVTYLLTLSQKSGDCLSFIQKLPLHAQTFFVYRTSP